MDECAYVKEGVTPRAAADADGRGRHTIHVSEERQTDGKALFNNIAVCAPERERERPDEKMNE